MEVHDDIGFVQSEGEAFAAVAERVGLGVEMLTCPVWNVRELVRHVGVIHLWAAASVAFPQDEWLADDDLSSSTPYWPELAREWPDDDGLLSWYRATHANLLRVLRTSPPDHECSAFLPAPTPLTMWARRQAHEIAIHRYDAASSAGIDTNYDAKFTADGLDELFSAMVSRPRPVEVSADRVVFAHATDVNEGWYLTLRPDGIETTRKGSHVDLAATGTSAELYLLFWNRVPDSTVTLSVQTGLMDVRRRSVLLRQRKKRPVDRQELSATPQHAPVRDLASTQPGCPGRSPVR